MPGRKYSKTQGGILRQVNDLLLMAAMARVW